MYASAATFALEGVRSHEVIVETDVRPGLPAFTLVGLPDRAVTESRERVRAALLNSGLEFPMRRLTVNLAPAHVRKAGPGFDLAIAVGLLAASAQVPREGLAGTALCGELSLTGEVRPVSGALAGAIGAREAGYLRLIVPRRNAGEAALVKGLTVIGAETLHEIAELLRGRSQARPAAPERANGRPRAEELDLADVRGQEDAKRALEIAAAGGHNLLMVGPPGVGKTMLARRLPGILPPPSFGEALEVTQIHGAAGLGVGGLARERPFRAPHHTISAQGLVGGGSVPRPGEITLAHRGVLFLDELPEFGRAALDALRQPLEEGCVEIVRGQRAIEFPARALLVAACNRCPCARPVDRCACSASEHARYLRRLSGPLLDRLDLVCNVEPVPATELAAVGAPRSSADVRRRVVAARRLQARRLRGSGALTNAEMGTRATRGHVVVDAPLAKRLIAPRGPLVLSARGHERVLKVARTIADLAGRERVIAADLEEALSHRLDGWERLAA